MKIYVTFSAQDITGISSLTAPDAKGIGSEDLKAFRQADNSLSVEISTDSDNPFTVIGIAPGELNADTPYLIADTDTMQTFAAYLDNRQQEQQS